MALSAALSSCAAPSLQQDDDLAADHAELATVPSPASTASLADPGVFFQGGRFYAFATGAGLREATSSTAGGPWTAPADVLDRQSVPAWVDLSKQIWAPDMIQAGNGDYVVYFAAALDASAGTPTGSDAPAGNAHCIGSARSKNATGRFAIDPHPVICLPGYGGSDDMTADPGDRVHGQGVIDPSPRQVTIDNETELFLVFKTQGTAPSTIRMVRLSNQDGSSVLGDSHQLLASTGNTQGDTLEGPSLLQHGSWFVLFVAHGNWDTCRYSTQWYRSQHIWSWSNAPTPLVTQSSTGLCGPGGADVTGSQVSGQDRIFLHGWINEHGAPAQDSDTEDKTGATRALYAAVLTWATDGFTPQVGEFLSP
jgi:arabinan endo-1,5-alpha-L-arabinosidase